VSQQFSVLRSDQGASSGGFFGTGQWGWQGSLTGLPLYEEEGRKLLHLGISYGYRNGTNNILTSPFKTVQLRARDELRDDVPDGSPSGAQAIPNGNSNRLIDTGNLAAASQYILGLELLQICGPFSVQAEYGWNFVNGVVGANPTGLVFNPAIKPGQNYEFNGGYVQLAYTLTGENRAYDRKIGTLARYYYGPGGPYTNAWLVRDENRRISFGSGAWELACRYTYVDLNDGSGLNRIAGGRFDGFTLALNWYLNRILNLVINWISDRRSDVPPGVFAGYVNGFGTELQVQF
jgi:phosphate-selective porin OprO/OprP